MADLTERLAAKLPHELRAERLSEWGNFIPEFALEVSTWADQILEFLLSEPELVAGLADEVRLSVLTERERAVMKLGEGVANVSGKIRLDLSVTVDNALAEVRALTPEVGND